jgi:hypothetical protein
MRRTLVALAVVLLLVLPLAAQEEAQKMEPISFLVEFQVKPDKTADVVNMVKKYDKPVLDGLMAEGAVLAWGLDTTVIYREDGNNFLWWFVTPDYAGMDKVFAAMDKVEASITPEDMATMLEAVNLSKRHDHIMRSIHVNVSDTPPAAPPYTNYASVKVMPGHGSDYLKVFQKYDAPVLDALVADGTIYGYGVDREDFHTEAPQWRFVWIVVPNMAAWDKVDAAFAADREKMSPAERSIMEHSFRDITEAGNHRDYFFRTVVMPGGPGM